MNSPLKFRVFFVLGTLSSALWSAGSFSDPPRAENGVSAATHLPQFYFVCQPKNDLYGVIAQGTTACPRFDSLSEALQSATDGSAVLVLADGYPDKTNDADPMLLELAAKKKIRFYLEYPTALPDLKIGEPQTAALERAVIASDFFGPELPPLRILAVNGLHFTPVEAEKPHIVAAKAAGYDNAVFGMPKIAHPLLFEYRGNVLVASTKLSNFLTGRHAPQDSWRSVWKSILVWLQPNARIPEIVWTPIVRPTFRRDEPLPVDIEKQAIRRGAEWFIRSKLLLHPSRLGDDWKKYQAAGGLAAASGKSLLPTPPADAPVGDGTLGILEGPLSVILPDGSQMQSVSRRGDCTAESAMALAFGGKLCDKPEQTKIAKNLLDFWYFTSTARKNERADPKHAAFGLMAWGIDTPAWSVAHYGDDNARLMLGTLAVAALTGEGRWDEGMMACLLANLRTAGRFGFRKDRLDLPELSKHDWTYFFRRDIKSYSPHMEAYLWACYLWAYQKTGCELFYDRAETALRMTMAQYTDGWRWTNGLSQEKARIILPLAWLVRVKDTPEHRRWLMQAVEGLLTLQDPCGAIREELGLPGHGMFPPPASNEAYGKKEAPIIQQNGDPVCDMLYTANFAFLGLHEAAAATGDPKIVAAENKLAEFLCRIQIRAETQPSLDGGWFRAFDFRRWEAWGSNADAGWGAWAIESGWTQGWITSVLAMRQMRTSLWDLGQKSGIEKHFERLRKQMLPEEVLKSLEPSELRHDEVGEKGNFSVFVVGQRENHSAKGLTVMHERHTRTSSMHGAGG